MYRVGLTGGIGSGKSLICSVLEKLRVPVYYADAEARSLMDSDPVLKLQIVDLFGEQAYSGGSLDRQYLAGRLFGDAELLASMNAVVHPMWWKRPLFFLKVVLTEKWTIRCWFMHRRK